MISDRGRDTYTMATAAASSSRGNEGERLDAKEHWMATFQLPWSYRGVIQGSTSLKLWNFIGRTISTKLPHGSLWTRRRSDAGVADTHGVTIDTSLVDTYTWLSIAPIVFEIQVKVHACHLYTKNIVTLRCVEFANREKCVVFNLSHEHDSRECRDRIWAFKNGLRHVFTHGWCDTMHGLNCVMLWTKLIAQ